MSMRDLLNTLLESSITAQFLLFAMYLIFGSPQKRPLHFALAALCLAIGGASLINTVAIAGGISWLHPLNLVLDLAVSPAIYLIVTQAKESAPPVGRECFLHVVPVALGLLIWEYASFIPLNHYMILVHSLYLFAIARIIYGQRNLGYETSVRRYVSALAGYLAVFTFLKLAIAIEANWGNINFRASWSYSTMLVMLLSLSSGMIFLVLRDPGILEHSRAFSKYKGSDLSPAETRMIIERLEHAFSQSKIHASPDLSLDEIASIVKAPARHVSQAINENFGMNVPTLVNFRRVEDAAFQLENEPDLSITSVMYECGFGSKTSFLRTFKQRYDQTPREYRRRVAVSETGKAKPL